MAKPISTQTMPASSARNTVFHSATSMFCVRRTSDNACREDIGGERAGGVFHQRGDQQRAERQHVGGQHIGQDQRQRGGRPAAEPERRRLRALAAHGNEALGNAGQPALQPHADDGDEQQHGAAGRRMGAVHGRGDGILEDLPGQHGKAGVRADNARDGVGFGRQHEHQHSGRQDRGRADRQRDLHDGLQGRRPAGAGRLLQRAVHRPAGFPTVKRYTNGQKNRNMTNTTPP